MFGPDRIINLTVQVRESDLLSLVGEDAVLDMADKIRERRVKDFEELQAEINHIARPAVVRLQMGQNGPDFVGT